MSLPSILVTGGTGSFGSAFVKHLLTQDTYRRIIVFSRDEFKQDQLAKSLGSDSRLRFFLGDVRDYDRLALALRDVQVVVHAAAAKQVPACENNPGEAVRTNVIGSTNLMHAALDMKVERVLALSTDKACSPVNLYGATKLCMERVLLAANVYAGPAFSIVRYGNVAGSRGSVVPFFRAKILNGEPLPITDVRMTRFWIRLDQAVNFVELKLAQMTGGELYVPRMPSVRVEEIAFALTGHFNHSVVGIRPGEKLHETVIGDHESVPGLPSPYTSDGNSEWLTGDALKRELEAV